MYIHNSAAGWATVENTPQLPTHSYQQIRNTWFIWKQFKTCGKPRSHFQPPTPLSSHSPAASGISYLDFLPALQTPGAYFFPSFIGPHWLCVDSRTPSGKEVGAWVQLQVHTTLVNTIPWWFHTYYHSSFKNAIRSWSFGNFTAFSPLNLYIIEVIHLLPQLWMHPSMSALQ